MANVEFNFFPGVLRIKSVAVGVLVIYGTKSKKYLAMTKRGKLYGTVSKKIRELENNY